GWVIGVPVIVVGRALRKPLSARRRAGLAAIFAVFACGVFAWLLHAAAKQGDDVLDGKPATSWVYPWNAPVVQVVGKDRRQPASLPAGCGIYLGSGEGSAVIVDPVSDQT